jgi:hypothetical protein
LIAGRTYALRYSRSDDEAPVEVRFLEYIARSRKAKIEHVAGEHPGLVEYIRTSQLLCSWKETKRLLRDERHDRELRASVDLYGVPAKAVRDAINTVFSTASEDVYVDVDGTATVRTDAIVRLAARSGLTDDETRSLSVLPAYCDRNGQLHLPVEAVQRLAQRFAAAEPETVNLHLDTVESEYRARGYELGERYLHKLLLELGPEHALARQWAGGVEQTHKNLEREITRLQSLVRQAALDLRRNGLEATARRLERGLTGG